MSKEELKKITEELFADFEETKIKLGNLGKFNPEAVFAVYAIIQDVVKKIEVYADTIQPLASEDKKAVAVGLVNDIVDIPWIPDFVEEALIGWSIDLVVDVFNKIGGNTWLESLFGAGPDE